MCRPLCSCAQVARSSRIEGTQHRRSAGAGDGGQVAGLAVDKAHGQPSKGRSFHPVGGEPQLGRAGDVPAGQQGGELPQQVAVVGATSAAEQFWPV